MGTPPASARRAADSPAAAAGAPLQAAAFGRIVSSGREGRSGQILRGSAVCGAMRMMRIIPAEQRHFADHDWLKTYWLFSFAEYYDPENVQFGNLRVFNDDVVAPREGFPSHPHREMEIVTIVLDGEVTHEDSLGNKTIIRAHDVQRMSAGTGIVHAEFNLAAAPVHFYQVWLTPRERHLAPSYAQHHFEPSDWHNKLAPLASGHGDAPIIINAEATLYRSRLDEKARVIHRVPSGRGTFVYVSAGALSVAGHTLHAGDQLRSDDTGDITIEALSPSEFILIDVAL